MVSMLTLLILVIALALIFDYINGFHDAANAIATVVSTGVLPVRTAVILAGVLNFAGAWAGTAVAKTIASGFAEAAIVTQVVILGALIGACIWNLLTWWYGIPSSSSHALIGGLAGAVVAHAGLSAFNWSNLVGKVLVPLVASPLIGFTPRSADHDRPAVAGPPHAPATVQRGSPAPPARLGVLHDGLLPRLQRRAEVDGHHHPRAGLSRRRLHRLARLDAAEG
jgi:hypothetical protein